MKRLLITIIVLLVAQGESSRFAYEHLRIITMVAIEGPPMIGGRLLAQEASSPPPKPAAPVLTDVQKLRLLNASKDIEIHQLRLDQAKLVMQRLVAESTPPGYRLTDQLELIRVPEPKEAVK